MVKPEDICNSPLRDVTAARGVIVLVLSSKRLVATAYNKAFFDQTYLNALIDTTVDMFCGQTATTAGMQLSRLRKNEVKNVVQELQVASGETCYFMARIPEKPDIALVLVAGKKANLGIGWAAVKQALIKLAPLCP